jgi:hypothetical protein
MANTFIDNSCKDLIEVRCEESAVLLGFAPKHFFEQSGERRIAARKTHQKVQEVEIKSIIFTERRFKVYRDCSLIYASVNREDWHNLVNKPKRSKK